MAQVLIISWIRAGALATWNAQAPEGMAVPVQSAIVTGRLLLGTGRWSEELVGAMGKSWENHRKMAVFDEISWDLPSVIKHGWKMDPRNR